MLGQFILQQNEFYIDFVLLLYAKQYQLEVKVAINHKVFPVFDDLECLFFLLAIYIQTPIWDESPKFSNKSGGRYLLYLIGYHYKHEF